MKVWTLNDRLIEEIVADYTDYATNPKSHYRQDYSPSVIGNLMIYNDGEGIKDLPIKSGKSDGLMRLPKPQPIALKGSVILILNLLFRGFLAHIDIDEIRHIADDRFNVPSEFLYKINHQYAHILFILEQKGIVECIPQWVRVGENRALSMFNIPRPDLFIEVDVDMLKGINRKHLKAKLEQHLKDLHQTHLDNLAEIQKRVGKAFVSTYNKNLSEFKIIDKEGALSVLKDYCSAQRVQREEMIRKLTYTPSKKNALSNQVELDNHELQKIDDNNRIYHLGTQLSKDLKPYTNINYSIDAKNSHPVLFNYFLLNFYLKGKNYINISNLSEPTSLSITHYTYNTSHQTHQYLTNNTPSKPSYHILSKKLCNYLKNNNIDKEITKRARWIHDDVLEYIHNSSRGLIWDEFMREGEDRSEIKRDMFGSVFYSYRTRRATDDELETRFYEKYPHVLKAIFRMKKEIHKYCIENALIEKRRIHKTITLKNYHKIKIDSRDMIQLSHLLMQLESKIFIEILKRLFKKGVKCFHIHDAIVVLDDTPETIVQSVMEDVYKSYGLIATFSIDRYGR